jgi:hypothetical protein
MRSGCGMRTEEEEEERGKNDWEGKGRLGGI